jgi:surface protein
VSNVTSTFQMFAGASSFNQDISGWDVSSVTDMNLMFNQAESFDQNIGGWDISNVTTMTMMLNNTDLSTENYDNTLIGWAAQNVQSGVELGASGLTYCNSTSERQSLIDDHSWTINDDGEAQGCEATSIEDEEAIPVAFMMDQNYPNPFNPTTSIRYGLPEAALVQITVYDLLGRKVAEPIKKRQMAGFHTFNFDASSLASGVYIYRITAGEFVQTRKMILVK